MIMLLPTDLCVSLLVMPLAMYVEVATSWGLGHFACNIWVSFDVTCCTASILNLCTISIDRYLTITRPLTYGVNASARRSFCFIAVIWVASCLISVPPLLIFGNEHGSSEVPECQVSQNIIYQLYATLGAFYIPLLVMIIMYYKIYVAAKKVVEAELKAQPSGSASMKLLRGSKHSHGNQSDVPDLTGVAKVEPPKSSLLLLGSTVHGLSNTDEKATPIRIVSATIRDLSTSMAPDHRHGNQQAIMSNYFPTQDSQEASGSSLVMTSHQNIEGTDSVSTVNQMASPTATSSHTRLYDQVCQYSLKNDHESVDEKHGILQSKGRGSTNCRSLSCARSQSDLRERKASVTLGVIMTAFTVCWLPFFILALLRPFSHSVYNIPPWIVSFALWLGYANSMLNPIIYVTFHQDFRQAFKYLLCFQCSSMGTRLRQEAYQHQFGNSNHQNHCINNNYTTTSVSYPSRHSMSRPSLGIDKTLTTSEEKTANFRFFNRLKSSDTANKDLNPNKIKTSHEEKLVNKKTSKDRTSVKRKSTTTSTIITEVDRMGMNSSSNNPASFDMKDNILETS